MTVYAAWWFLPNQDTRCRCLPLFSAKRTKRFPLRIFLNISLAVITALAVEEYTSFVVVIAYGDTYKAFAVQKAFTVCPFVLFFYTPVVYITLPTLSKCRKIHHSAVNHLQLQERLKTMQVKLFPQLFLTKTNATVSCVINTVHQTLYIKKDQERTAKTRTHTRKKSITSIIRKLYLFSAV